MHMQTGWRGVKRSSTVKDWRSVGPKESVNTEPNVPHGTGCFF